MRKAYDRQAARRATGVPGSTAAAPRTTHPTSRRSRVGKRALARAWSGSDHRRLRQRPVRDHDLLRGRGHYGLRTAVDGGVHDATARSGAVHVGPDRGSQGRGPGPRHRGTVRTPLAACVNRGPGHREHRHDRRRPGRHRGWGPPAHSGPGESRHPTCRPRVARRGSALVLPEVCDHFEVAHARAGSVLTVRLRGAAGLEPGPGRHLRAAPVAVD